MEEKINTCYVPVGEDSIGLILRGLELLQRDCLHAAGEHLSQATGGERDSIIMSMANENISQAKQAGKLADEIAKMKDENISHPEVDKMADFLRQYFPSSIQGGKTIADNAIMLLKEYLEMGSV